MNAKLSCLSLLTTVVLFAGASQANAQAYTFTDLGTLRGTNSQANAINDAGQVVGWASTTGDAAAHAALWNGTTATDLGTLYTVFGNHSQAYAINNAGQVAGYSDNISAYDHAALWNGTTVTDINTGAGSYAYAINDAGQVAGGAFDFVPGSSSAGHATLWNGISATDLGALYGNYSRAYAINNAGQVAGVSGIPGGFSHAVLWNGSTATDLGTLGGTNSEANAINDAGQVAGWANITGDAVQHATLWNGSTATDLNSFLNASAVSAGWVLTHARGINDNGWIVGDAHNSKSGVDHAFLLAPIPEPETYAMLLVGLGLLGFIARRNKTA